MKLNRAFLFRALTVLVLLAIAGVMLIIGRGHTVYLDNKELVYDGKTYTCPYKVEVNVGGEQIAKLYEKERGMTPHMGQSFNMTLSITEKKGGSEETREIALKLPYNLDGIVINLPALLAGLPEEAYLTEFVSLATETETEDEEVVIDEFAMTETEPAV